MKFHSLDIKDYLTVKNNLLVEVTFSFHRPSFNFFMTEAVII